MTSRGFGTEAARQFLRRPRPSPRSRRSTSASTRSSGGSPAARAAIVAPVMGASDAARSDGGPAGRRPGGTPPRLADVLRIARDEKVELTTPQPERAA